MNFKKQILLIIILSNSISTYSQLLENTKSNLINDLIQYDSTYKILDNYLKEKNWVDKNENYPMYTFNILTYKENDINSELGIFIFGIKYSDPLYCFYYKNKNNSYIIDSGESFTKTLQNTLEFINTNEIKSPKDQLEYILSIVKYYNSRNDYIIKNDCLPHKWNKCE